MTSFPKFLNNIYATLSSVHSPGSGSLALSAGQGAQFGSSFPCRVTVITQGTYQTAAEVLSVFDVTGRTGDTLTGLTPAEGYSDQSFVAGDVVEVRWTAGEASLMATAINALEGLPAAGAADNGELLIGNGTGFTKASLTPGTGISISVGAGSITITNTGSGGGGGGGGLTSVGLSMPTGFSVGSSPLIANGTIAVTTSLVGLVKASGGAFSAAVADTDYVSPSGLSATLSSYATEGYVTTIVSGYASLSGSYSDPSWITSLAASKITHTGLVVASNAGVIIADTDGATVTFDLSVSNWHSVTLGGNRTLAIANELTAQQFTLILTQDATGSRTVTWWSGIKWAGGSPPTLSTAAGAVDVLSFKAIGGGVYFGFFVGKGMA